MVGAGDLDLVATGVHQLDLRAHDLGRAAALGVDHHQRRQAGHVVDLLGHRQAFLDVLELDRAGVLGDDGTRQRIPVGQDGAGLDRLVGLHRQDGAVGHLVALALATVLVVDGDLARARNHHQLTLGVGDVAHGRVEADAARRLGLDTGRHRRARRRATDVEGAHGQLRAGLADRLRGDDTHGLADVDQAAATQIAAVALGADAEARATGQGRAHAHFVDAGGLELVNRVLVEHLPGPQHDFLRFGADQVFGGGPAQDALAQRFDHFTALDDGAHQRSIAGTAVLLGHHQVLGHVDQAAREVTGVGGLQRRVGQALAGAVRGDEVLQHVQAFTEVGRDGRLDDRAVGLGHQAAHARQLANLRRAAARARVGHHVDGVERLLLDFLAVAILGLLLGQLGHHDLGDFVAGLAPDVDHLVVAFAGGDQARDVLLLDFLDLFFGALDDAGLLARHQHVLDGDRDAGARGQPEAVLQQLVGKNHGFLQAALAEAGVDQARDFLLLERLVHLRERQALGQNLRQQGAAGGGFDHAGGWREFTGRLVLAPFGQAHADPGGQLDHAGGQGALDFADVGKDHALALAVDALARGVVQAQHHVLRGHDGGLARGGEQHVVGGQHQRARLHLCFHGQRHVHGHLVTVEVGVEGRADQRVQLDGLAFDQDGLEGLDAQAVQRGCAVEQHRVLLDHLFQDVPDHGRTGFDFLLRCLDGGGDAHGFEAREDEGLEQLQGHQLGQAALVQLQLRAHGDHGTARVVHALAQQVLAEAAGLALDHVGQRLERALVRARHGLAAAAVVQQRVHGLLQHALFVARNDLGGLQLQQAAQARVAVDDAAVQVVQVRGRKAAAVQRHQRTQVRGQHGQDFQHHPLGLDAGLLEGFEHLQALGVLLDLDFGAGQVAAQLLDRQVDVDGFEQILDAFGAHLGDELVAVFLALGVVVVLGHDAELLQRGHARVGHHVGFKVQHAFDVAQRHVQHQAQARWQRLQEPDVGARRGQVDVAHALAAHLGLRDFHAALLADHTAVLQALVLAAQAFVVLDGTKNLGAEQAVTLGLERTVVDGLGLLHFAERPRTDLLGRSHADADGIEMLVRRELLEQVE